MEMQTATDLGEKKFLGQIVPGNFGGNAANRKIIIKQFVLLSMPALTK